MMALVRARWKASFSHLSALVDAHVVLLSGTLFHLSLVSLRHIYHGHVQSHTRLFFSFPLALIRSPLHPSLIELVHHSLVGTGTKFIIVLQPS